MSWEISRKTTIAIYFRQVLARKKERKCISFGDIHHFSLSDCYPRSTFNLFCLHYFVGSEIAGEVIETGEGVKHLSKVISRLEN